MSIYLEAGQYDAFQFLRWVIQDWDDEVGINAAAPIVEKLHEILIEMREADRVRSYKTSQSAGAL